LQCAKEVVLQGFMPTTSEGMFNKKWIIFAFVRQVGFTPHELTSHERIKYQIKS
jgi:hypothetical protein